MHLHLKLLLLSQNISKGSAHAVGETLIKDRYMLHTLAEAEGECSDFFSPLDVNYNVILHPSLISRDQT